MLVFKLIFLLALSSQFSIEATLFLEKSRGGMILPVKD